MSAAAHHSAKSLLRVGMRRHVSASECMMQDAKCQAPRAVHIRGPHTKIRKLSGYVHGLSRWFIASNGRQRPCPSQADCMPAPSTRPRMGAVTPFSVLSALQRAKVMPIFNEDGFERVRLPLVACGAANRPCGPAFMAGRLPRLSREFRCRQFRQPTGPEGGVVHRA